MIRYATDIERESAPKKADPCQCLEIGADGSRRHFGNSGFLIVGTHHIEVCHNHLRNYEASYTTYTFYDKPKQGPLAERARSQTKDLK